MTDLYRLLPAEMDELVTSLGHPRYRSDQVLRALYRGEPCAIADLRQLPLAMQEALSGGGWTIGSAQERSATISDDGETTKVLLEMASDALIETVLMQYPQRGQHPRSTVCVSTQAGCAMGCVFCASGQMGFERNLPAEEIVAQVIHFAQLLRRRGEHITNVVYMGMGEPLANYAETVRSIRILVDPRGFGLSHRAVTVSTVGILRGIERLAEERLGVNLAISLHAPNDALRKELVPTAAAVSVGPLIEAAKAYRAVSGRRVSLEYALINGVNDSPELARELARLVRGKDLHINLIPVNPTAGGFQRPPRQRVLAFRSELAEAHVNCTIRVEKGSEIAAACGQLRVEATRPPARPGSEAPGSRRPPAPSRSQPPPRS